LATNVREAYILPGTTRKERGAHLTEGGTPRIM